MRHASFRSLVPLVAALSGCAQVRAQPRDREDVMLRADATHIAYPAMLRSANIEGDVVVDLHVLPDGRVERARSRVLRSDHDLFALAVWKGFDGIPFRAARLGGVPVASAWRDTVTFTLVRDSTSACPAARAHHRVVCAASAVSARWTGMSQPERSRWLGMLAVGRARWERTRPPRYRVELTREAGMIAPVEPGRTLSVEVAGSRIVAVTTGQVSGSTSRVWWEGTIDDLFTLVERHLRTTNAQVATLDLDPDYGFPRRLSSDIPFTTDSDTDIRVTRFEPLR